jgi:putative phosphoribosyl transferase
VQSVGLWPFVWQWIEKAPAVRLYPEERRRVRWLNKGEATRLLDALPTHQKQFTRFALATGLGQANVLGLKWPRCRSIWTDRRVALTSVDRRPVARSTLCDEASEDDTMSWQQGFEDWPTARFQDRTDAAEQLANALKRWRGANPLIEAIPRGAVPMGKIIADALDGDLDVVLTRKLHAPGAPELAIGAVDETGWVYVADHARATGADDAYIRGQVADQLETIRRRRRQYTPDRPPRDPRGRVVIVVDDGLATGATMIAALHSMRAQRPLQLVCAVPVASPEAVDKVRAYADEVVVLRTPAYFSAVGQFYAQFPQVEDAEVIALLRAQRPKVAAQAPNDRPA